MCYGFIGYFYSCDRSLTYKGICFCCCVDTSVVCWCEGCCVCFLVDPSEGRYLTFEDRLLFQAVNPGRGGVAGQPRVLVLAAFSQEWRT